jgi:retinol-binding protein 3
VAAPPAAPASAGREARRALIESIGLTLRERYIDPDRAERMIAALHEHWERGDYDSADDASLAKIVRADLRAVSHDEHVGLFFGAGGAARPPGSERAASRVPNGDRRFGFGPSQRLSGNVALLPLFGFVPAPEAATQRGIADIMTQVADAAALIIDLRDNNGGRAPTLALIASYLLDGSVLLSRVERRYDQASYELRTHAEVKGKRFGGKKPLYLLTSARTFSGGEALAYHLQALGRAKVIGETTRGGSFGLVQMFELGGDFRLGVTTARSIGPVTQSRREGAGVIPDVSVPADRAVEEAHRRALEDLARSSGESAG